MNEQHEKPEISALRKAGEELALLLSRLEADIDSLVSLEENEVKPDSETSQRLDFLRIKREKIKIRQIELATRLAELEEELDEGGPTTSPPARSPIDNQERRRSNQIIARHREGREWQEKVDKWEGSSVAAKGALDYFHRVAEKVGIHPPGNPPKPPAIHLGGGPGPEPISFWDPDLEGGEFSETAEVIDGFPTLSELDPIFELPELGDQIPPRREPNRELAREFRGHTIDTIAYYHPWHSGGDEYWGIYFRMEKMRRFIDSFERFLGEPYLSALLLRVVFEHEMEHYYQEKAMTVLEDLLNAPSPQVFPDGAVSLLDPLDNSSQIVEPVIEALASAREIQVAKKMRQEQEGCPDGLVAGLEEWKEFSPPGYREFFLCTEKEGEGRGRAGFLNLHLVDLLPGLKTGQTADEIDRVTADAIFGVRVSGLPVPVRFVHH